MVRKDAGRRNREGRETVRSGDRENVRVILTLPKPQGLMVFQSAHLRVSRFSLPSNFSLQPFRFPPAPGPF